MCIWDGDTARPEWEREAWRPDEGEDGPTDPWEGWPEGLAGPEYWLHKRDAEDGEV